MIVLRRLRKQMVLLNAVISGAILLIMALVAQNVTVNIVTRQYEQDLQRNTDALMTTMQEAGSAGLIQFGVNYSIYYRHDKVQRLVSAAGEDGDVLRRVALQGQTALQGKINQANMADLADDQELQVQRFFSASAVYSDSPNGLPISLLQERLLLIMPNLLLQEGGNSYRVSTILSLGRPMQQITVLQNRADELATIRWLRWLFFGCVLGGLALIGCASLYLSTRSIRPVERSLRQQRDFVAAASHELRTPVAAVRANAEVLADANLGEFAPYLEAIAHESERMSRLVSDLIDLARADAGELQVREEAVDCAEAARRTLTLLAPLAAQKGVELTSALEPAPCKADPDRLCQVLVVLLDNAIRYTPAGGEVRITSEKSGSHAWVRVTDEGPGIPDQHKEQVFERFFRMDAARATDGGCGLGLSIARQLVERMHGTLTLADRPGGGCVFSVKLR
jgi:signal transduction histidine kinase